MMLPLLFLLGQTGFEKSPVIDLVKTMVGGEWTGTVGKDVPVSFRFSQAKSGLIVGEGLVNGGSAHPMIAHMSLGWDEDAKQVYYLDQHGLDTVYFGHVTREGNQLVFDFKGIVGDVGHYLTKVTLNGDDYTSTMSSEKDGKWTDLGFHLGLHRKR